MSHEEHYTADRITWSIYKNTDGPVEQWEDEDRVGHDTIAELPDGDYWLVQPHLRLTRDAEGKFEHHWSRQVMKQKIKVRDGRVDIQSCKKAVAEFCNRTGDWHTFIESVEPVIQEGTPPSVRFFLGS